MPETRRAPTIEDLLNVTNVGDPQLSPDGEMVAFVVADKYEKAPRTWGDAATPVAADHYATHRQRPKSRIWQVSARGGEARPLTTGPGTDNSPRWSPDGQTLAFLSDRGPEGTMQVYLLPRHGGEARRLADVEGNASWPEWSPDGRFVSFLLGEPPTPEETRRQAERDDAIEVEKDPKFLRLWVVDVATGEARIASPEKLQIWDYDWSPDGSRFVALVSDEPFVTRWYYARYVTFPAGGGTPRTIYATDRQLAGARWSPDGRWIAFIRGLYSDRGSIGGDVYVVPADGGEARNLTPDWPASANWLEWSADSASLIVAAHDEGQISLHAVPLDGAPRRLWREAANISGRTWPRFNRFGDALRFAAARTTLADPADVWLFEVGAGPGREVASRRLTEMNPQTRELLLPETEVISWPSFDGWTIPGFLLKPPGYRQGQRYPTLVQIHGGPASLYGYAYPGASNGHLLAQRGFVVFLPNPRGSRGWGERFVEGNLHDQGGADLRDILAGVDHLVAAGIADPDRLGVAGGSFGGFMTAWAITQTPRFKAAMMSCGVANWRSYHGTADIQAWDEIYYGASPYDVPGVYDRYSPITHVKNVVTPTLIVHGAEDNLVPVSQGYEMIRALKDLGVEVELVVYPREGHGILEWAHQLDQANRIVAWFEAKLGARAEQRE